MTTKHILGIILIMIPVIFMSGIIIQDILKEDFKYVLGFVFFTTCLTSGVILLFGDLL